MSIIGEILAILVIAYPVGRWHFCAIGRTRMLMGAEAQYERH